MSTPSPQSAAERKAAEAELRTLLTKHAPAHLRLTAATRKALRKRLPAAHEVVYEYRDFVVISFSPSGHGYEGVLAIHSHADGVKLYFNHGKRLPDPDKLLKGSASQVRFITLEGASTLTRPAVVSLMDAAIAHNQVPFASDGEGSVVIRSTTAGKKPRPAKRAKKPSKTTAEARPAGRKPKTRKKSG